MPPVKKPKRQTHSASNRIYTCTVEGEYYASTETDRNTIKRYKIDVKIPEKQMDSALSIIVRNLLEPALRAKYENYIRYRTHEITASTSDDDPTASADDPKFMNRQELIEYIDEYGLIVKPHLYPRLSELQEAVAYCIRDEEEFELEQKSRTSLYEDDFLLQESLQKLNPGFQYDTV